METSALYRVQREDLPRLQKMLTECFAEDPLYHTLNPGSGNQEAADAGAV